MVMAAIAAPKISFETFAMISSPRVDILFLMRRRLDYIAANSITKWRALLLHLPRAHQVFCPKAPALECANQPYHRPTTPVGSGARQQSTPLKKSIPR
jgi:hypothetical protein